MKRLIALALVVALQTAALAAMVVNKQWTLITGTPVVLKTEPIDPRSLFRGDYVRLNYAISVLEKEKFPNIADFRKHDSIHILLRQGETWWEPVSIHKERPEAPEGQVAIRGEVMGNWGRWRDGEQVPGLNVRFGIENYFVPEGEGMALERPADGEVVSILVAVDESGAAGIKGVLVNGELRYEETLF